MKQLVVPSVLVMAILLVRSDTSLGDGVGADLFKEKGNTVPVRLKVTDDNATTKQILVTNTDENLGKADREFDAIFKGHGNTNFGGRVAVAYQRIELDEQGKLINKFAVTSTSVSPETKFVFGKYNEKERRWEAGEEVTGVVWNEMFNDPGAMTIYLRITKRDDDRGIAQVLVRQIGESRKK